MGQTENDMVLGTSAYKNGLRATTFGPRDKGIGYLVGAGELVAARLQEASAKSFGTVGSAWGADGCCRCCTARLYSQTASARTCACVSPPTAGSLADTL
jgi:hypothetical protein